MIGGRARIGGRGREPVFYCSKLPMYWRMSNNRRKIKNRRKSKRTGFLLLKIAATT